MNDKGHSVPISVERRLERLLAANVRWRDPQQEARNLSQWLVPLQRWQSTRLERSFADFLAAPDTHDAAVFFLNDLYGDRDVSARDRNVERVMPMMKRLLPAPLLETAADAIELAVLSHAFDLRMAAALEVLVPVAVDTTAAAREAMLDDSLYAQAYRQAGLPYLRGHQIDLIVGIGMALSRAVRKAWLARLLRLSRLPAWTMGLKELQGFLERGFSAFAKMQDASAFMNEIARREREISRRLFAHDFAPFSAADRQANSRSR